MYLLEIINILVVKSKHWFDLTYIFQLLDKKGYIVPLCGSRKIFQGGRGAGNFCISHQHISQVRSKFGPKHGPPSRTLEAIGPQRNLLPRSKFGPKYGRPSRTLVAIGPKRTLEANLDPSMDLPIEP